MFYILLAIGIFILDLKIKNHIEENKEMHQKEEILGGNIILNRYHNKGAFLNIFEDKPKFIKTLSCLLLGLVLLTFAIVIPKDRNRWVKLGLSLILGGAASNTYDRVKRGYVVDYFSFKFLKKIIFNISDICIFIGSALLLISELFNDK